METLCWKLQRRKRGGQPRAVARGGDPSARGWSRHVHPSVRVQLCIARRPRTTASIAPRDSRDLSLIESPTSTRTRRVRKGKGLLKNFYKKKKETSSQKKKTAMTFLSPSPPSETRAPFSRDVVDVVSAHSPVPRRISERVQYSFLFASGFWNDGVIPPHPRRGRNHDALDAAAVQTELDSSVVEEVKLDVPSAALMVPLGVFSGVPHQPPSLDYALVRVDETGTDRRDERGGVSGSRLFGRFRTRNRTRNRTREVIKKNAPDASVFFPGGYVKILVAPPFTPCVEGSGGRLRLRLGRGLAPAPALAPEKRGVMVVTQVSVKRVKLLRVLVEEVIRREISPSPVPRNAVDLEPSYISSERGHERRPRVEH